MENPKVEDMRISQAAAGPHFGKHHYFSGDEKHGGCDEFPKCLIYDTAIHTVSDVGEQISPPDPFLIMPEEREAVKEALLWGMTTTRRCGDSETHRILTAIALRFTTP